MLKARICRVKFQLQKYTDIHPCMSLEAMKQKHHNSTVTHGNEVKKNETGVLE